MRADTIEENGEPATKLLLKGFDHQLIAARGALPMNLFDGVAGLPGADPREFRAGIDAAAATEFSARDMVNASTGRRRSFVNTREDVRLSWRLQIACGAQKTVGAVAGESYLGIRKDPAPFVNQ